MTIFLDLWILVRKQWRACWIFGSQYEDDDIFVGSLDPSTKKILRLFSKFSDSETSVDLNKLKHLKAFENITEFVPMTPAGLGLFLLGVDWTGIIVGSVTLFEIENEPHTRYVPFSEFCFSWINKKTKLFAECFSFEIYNELWHLRLVPLLHRIGNMKSRANYHVWPN
jgi:hypothetical protein